MPARRIVLFSGLLLGASAERPCPPGMVPTGTSACIDEFEWPNERGVHPMVGLSGVAEEADLAEGAVMDLERLCAGAGKRVCTIEEWTAACRGPGASRFPFGDRLPRFSPDEGGGLCNYDRWFRTPDEYKVMSRDQEEMGRLDQTEPSGARETCRSASGAHDMMGSVEEWVRCPGIGAYGWCLMGRYWAEPATCSFAVARHSPKWHYYETGGRCCSEMK